MTTTDQHPLPATRTRAEVESQPAIWTRVLAESLRTSAVLPTAGTPVLFVGCGTSYYVGESYARLRNDAGLGRTRAAIASEIPYLDPAETLVVLSRSGTTTDVLRVVEQLRGSTSVIGVVGEAGTPVAEACDRTLLLDYADETSIVQTRFATSALLLLRASLVGAAGDAGDAALSELPAQAGAALVLPLPDPLPRHVVFLGAGWTIGLAHEAALKCREAAGAWTESYALMEYQHGPIAVAGPGTLVWSFGPVPEFVADPVRATGATLVAPELDPLAQLPAVHRLALALAAAAGRDPDRPHHLSRSVQLD
ncbi:Fructoselysine-6-P-deglycase FrlB with duplicated sugar isomerase (SIS) domain [Jatrophihabitans endophyticus]|uniref:Fructoselysine-6-P-deglycase FrlB with duplicated sugar isomerase (SIS) domain n=1 Tax=Jatrophihabitans endophyticus TaxID=1206085 RepID=A0A1M5CKZ5_9ACTN|nr:SIS domain-containing protein [Jatrophihabitans endophyticus]SHF55277.1 Fructoselysine-6-P-deglycase FrlB with duplicated sugar isomerase (SIS) domain [Jatrophihabitans endophyticus]